MRWGSSCVSFPVALMIFVCSWKSAAWRIVCPTQGQPGLGEERGKQAWHALIRVPRVWKDSLALLQVTGCPHGIMPSVTSADTSRLVHWARSPGWSLDAASLCLTPSENLLGMSADFQKTLQAQRCSTAPTHCSAATGGQWWFSDALSLLH